MNPLVSVRFWINGGDCRVDLSRNCRRDDLSEASASLGTHHSGLENQRGTYHDRTKERRSTIRLNGICILSLHQNVDCQRLYGSQLSMPIIASMLPETHQHESQQWLPPPSTHLPP